MKDNKDDSLLKDTLIAITFLIFSLFMLIAFKDNIISFMLF